MPALCYRLLAAAAVVLSLFPQAGHVGFGASSPTVSVDWVVPRDLVSGQPSVAASAPLHPEDVMHRDHLIRQGSEGQSGVSEVTLLPLKFTALVLLRLRDSSFPSTSRCRGK